MRHLKILGLAVVASVALHAFVGISIASATTLFTDEKKTIPYPKGTTLLLTLQPGTSFTLADGGQTIATCTESTRHETTQVETGTWITRSIDSFTWGGCNQTTDTLTTGSSEINSSGTVTDKGMQVTLQIFGVSCTYGTGEGTDVGTLTSGTNPTLKVEAVIKKTAGGFLCRSSLTWEAVYNITAPHSLWVGP